VAPSPLVASTVFLLEVGDGLATRLSWRALQPVNRRRHRDEPPLSDLCRHPASLVFAEPPGGLPWESG